MRLGVAAITPALLFGCASEPLKHAEFVILSEGEPTQLELCDLLPPAGVDSRWSSIDAGGATEITCSLTKRDEAVNYRNPSQETQHLVVADGGLALAIVESPRDDAVTSFEPPLLAYPAHLANEWTDCAAAMRVQYCDPARGERDAGKANLRSRVSGTARVRTPMGEFDTVVIESVFTAQLRLATAENFTKFYVVPGVGSIAEVLRRRIWVLGLPIQSRDSVVVRRAAPSTTEGEI